MEILGKIYNGMQILTGSIKAAFEDIFNDILTILKIFGYFGVIVVVSALISFFLYDVIVYLSPLQAISTAAGFLLLVLIALR